MCKVQEMRSGGPTYVVLGRTKVDSRYHQSTICQRERQYRMMGRLLNSALPRPRVAGTRTKSHLGSGARPPARPTPLHLPGARAMRIPALWSLDRGRKRARSMAASAWLQSTKASVPRGLKGGEPWQLAVPAGPPAGEVDRVPGDACRTYVASHGAYAQAPILKDGLLVWSNECH